MILENPGFISEDFWAHLETLLHFFVFPWEEVCEERSLDHDLSPQVPLHSNPASHTGLSDAVYNLPLKPLPHLTMLRNCVSCGFLNGVVFVGGCLYLPIVAVTTDFMLLDLFLHQYLQSYFYFFQFYFILFFAMLFTVLVPDQRLKPGPEQ